MTITNDSDNVLADPVELRKTNNLIDESSHLVAKDYQALVTMNDDLRGNMEGEVLTSFMQMDDYLREKVAMLGVILQGMHQNTDRFATGLENVNAEAELKASTGEMI